MVLAMESLGESSSIIIITTLVIATTIACYFGTTYILKRASLIRVPDRDVLKGVFNAGGGSTWDVQFSENWCNADKKLSEWAGIEATFASGHEQVVEIIMRGNSKFTGTQHNHFANLPY